MDATDRGDADTPAAAPDELGPGRACFADGAWSAAREQLLAADRLQPLPVADLERLAVATYLLGHEPESTEVWARAYEGALSAGDELHAVRCAFWVAFVLLNRDEAPAANGWIQRCRRLLQAAAPEAVEHGHLAYLEGLRAIFGGDAAGARGRFVNAARAGRRGADADLHVLSLLGEARAAIHLDDADEGVALLDEALVALGTDRVSPIVVGDSCCTAIEGCQEVFDLTRARRWTEQLSTWCEEHPELVAFRGQCRLHRAELLQLRGAWSQAIEEALGARERLARPAGQLALGEARYQEGELHRLRGERAAAEDAYGQARRRGREPQPGLALLRLAQGRPEAAAAAIRRALAEAEQPPARCRLLPGAVEILLAVDQPQAASGACEELEELASRLGSPFLDATSARARGALELAAGKPGPALARLRQALERWQDLEVPYEAARTRVLIGRACRDLGDREAAAAEWGLARETFRSLGAATALADLDEQAGVDHAGHHGLTDREREVLRWVASGSSNRSIAEQLVISERTVESHVSSILTKLQVNSRAGATAWAHRHGLV